MKQEQFMIPKGVHLVIDDMGWLYGRDQRDVGLSSRTGIPRLHTIEDYMVIEEVGKEIGQKINAMFVIGEWDRKRTLAKVPGSNKWGADWQQSEFFNEAEISEIRDFLNDAKYIELGFHGLLHDSWDAQGNFICDGEFFLPENDGETFRMIDPDSIRCHMDAFYEIYNDWNLKAPIRTYASPCGSKNGLLTGALTPILREYDLQFWHNAGTVEEWSSLIPTVQNGIAIANKSFLLCPWEAYDLDPDEMPLIPEEELGIIGGHWVNFLRQNPKKNTETVKAWGRWFRRQAQQFGALVTEDIAQCHYQQQYEMHTVVTVNGDEITLDVSAFDRMLPGVEADLFINVKNGVTPTCRGGDISMYRQQDDFANYRIRRQKGVSQIVIK